MWPASRIPSPLESIPTTQMRLDRRSFPRVPSRRASRPPAPSRSSAPPTPTSSRTTFFVCASRSRKGGATWTSSPGHLFGRTHDSSQAKCPVHGRHARQGHLACPVAPLPARSKSPCGESPSVPSAARPRRSSPARAKTRARPSPEPTPSPKSRTMPCRGSAPCRSSPAGACPRT
jgi:hypothetical protein